MEALKASILVLPPSSIPLTMEKADRLFVSMSDGELMTKCSKMFELSPEALRTRVAEALSRLRYITRLDLVSCSVLRDGTRVYLAPDLSHWMGAEGAQAYEDFELLRETGLAAAAGYE